MDHREGEEEPEAEVGRRDFLKRMAALAFAVPVVSSFTLDPASHTQQHNKRLATLTAGNQICFPNQVFSNQTLAYFPNQTFPNQYTPNQLASES
jgi:hypothetical protein